MLLGEKCRSLWDIKFINHVIFLLGILTRESGKQSLFENKNNIHCAYLFSISQPTNKNRAYFTGHKWFEQDYAWNSEKKKKLLPREPLGELRLLKEALVCDSVLDLHSGHSHQSPTTEKCSVALKADAGVNDPLKGLSVCLGQQGNWEKANSPSGGEGTAMEGGCAEDWEITVKSIPVGSVSSQALMR